MTVPAVRVNVAVAPPEFTPCAVNVVVPQPEDVDMADGVFTSVNVGSTRVIVSLVSRGAVRLNLYDNDVATFGRG